ncbi:glycosyltransferase [Microbacterium sp. T2.11-28]|uniref:glycosyltransferase n=1 Tax=Microbacterium sp. T2.11-28 TaxID=3041169 RepID=UPI002477BBD1|nr:glycosyltransferase [Microbacterium sp. T2.11-28]CAI9391561.1 hypothetical protein MICABA_01810 [Microbacterium sp. T2.11-28]
MTTLLLSAAMPLHGEVEREEATWVGLLDADRLTPATDTLLLDGGERFDRARLLVRDDAGIRGYVAVPVSDGAADAAVVREAVDALPPAAGLPEPAVVPVTVVVCTRERPETLRETLHSLGALEWEALEVVVVDNAPATTRTAELVAREHPDFRYVREDAAGLSHARNAGLRAATSSIVAFTDDDVIVDPQWVRRLAAGFAVGDDVGCVTGAVPSGELRNAVQSYFDARVSWSKLIVPRVFRLSDPPADLPMFPFCVGEFGTGANFAVRRDTMVGLGGFDSALGAGTGTQGGEDLDMFLRILYADAAIVVEPAAIVWHRHRADLAALTAQAVGYGRGFGAWATTVVLDPRMLGAAVRRAPRAVSRLLRKPMTTVDGAATTRAASEADRSVARRELRSILGGPASYLRESRRQRDAGVYAGPSSRGAVLERRLWAAIAAAAGVLGLLAALPLPTGLSLALLACFVLVGPGAVVRAWVPLSPPLTSLAVPALGLTAMILLVTASAFAAWWQPALALAAISAATLAVAAATFRAGVRA